MRTMEDYEVGRQYAPPMPADGTPEVTGAGWLVFATVMLGLSGLFNFFDGIAAISSAHFYVANASYVFSDLNTWGWIIMALGIVQGFAAFMLLSGSEFARWFGIASASVNAVGQLMFLQAYPWWAMAMFAVDILIIYGLAVYGGSRLRSI